MKSRMYQIMVTIRHLRKSQTVKPANSKPADSEGRLYFSEILFEILSFFSSDELSSKTKRIRQFAW